ncbi:MAG: hypothetical protein RBS88_12035 [Spongiibacteraceae bacterium]|jgi:ElaB/YqjD/DUF883 family membrane-anchored ribosome-binding protein|nr:hypothetical protein [Spongiibacteraceae bacterium]
MDTTAPNNQPSSGTTGRVAQKAHEVVDRVAEQAAQAEEKLRSARDNASERLHASTDELRARADSLNMQISDYVQAHPLTSLGVAFGAGLLLAAILRR